LNSCPNDSTSDVFSIEFEFKFCYCAGDDALYRFFLLLSNMKSAHQMWTATCVANQKSKKNDGKSSISYWKIDWIGHQPRKLWSIFGCSSLSVYPKNISSLQMVFRKSIMAEKFKMPSKPEKYYFFCQMSNFQWISKNFF
jgi:hypothetical protein